jgi:hypothetical protein
VYDFNVNKLLICGVGPNDDTCGITVEKNLFTPRLDIAYRPAETLVIRAGYSRNPQSNNPGLQQLPPAQAFPQTVIITETAPNNFSAVGSLSEGSPVVPLLDLSSRVLSLPDPPVNRLRVRVSTGELDAIAQPPAEQNRLALRVLRVPR